MAIHKIEKITGEEELNSCAELLVEAYNSEPWNDEWTTEIALDKLVTFYRSPKFYGWMVFDKDQLVGCCVGNIEPYFTGPYFYLKEMFVSPKYQGKGIGHTLLTHIKAEMKAIDVNMIILFTSNEGFPYKFYKKHDFADMDGMRMMGFGDMGEE